jgi:putative MATE family efflux protein
MSEYFGARKYGRLKQAMATMLLFGGAVCLAVAAIGFALAPLILRFLKVPQEIFEITVVYLRITFLGAPATFIYNAIAAGMKSVGDSRTPLKFLMFSALLNAGLDLIFLGLLGFGIVCSAVTTVVAEAVSAGLAAYYMAIREPVLSPFGSRWSIDGDILADILRYGLPSALQQTIQPVCKVLIQGQVNALGVSSIAAFNAVTRVDDFACIPEQGIGASISTFVAQNRGAGRKDRIRPGYRAGVTLGLMYYVVICAVGLFLRRPIVCMFVTGSGAEEVVRLGSEYLGVMAFFYLWPALTNAVQGFFRGMGKMFTTVIFTFVQASIRTVSTMILAPRMGIVGIAYSCMIGWSVMLFFETIYYFITCKKLGLPRKEEQVDGAV